MEIGLILLKALGLKYKANQINKVDKLGLVILVCKEWSKTKHSRAMVRFLAFFIS